MRKAFVVVNVAMAMSACATSHSTAGSDCPALVGPEPWLALFEGGYSSSCVTAGIHQDLQIWNKGTEPVTVEGLGAIHEIGSDEHYSTGPLGEVVEPGEYRIESSPYAAPTLNVVDPNDSFSAETELTLDGFGEIEVGMTLKEAARHRGRRSSSMSTSDPGPTVGTP